MDSQSDAEETPPPSKGTLRILLADDHALVREGLKHLLDAQPDFEVVGEAADGQEVVERAALLQPDVVVMDISMPGVNGVQAAQMIRQSGSAVAILALTVHEDKGYLRELFEAGASGFLLKRSAAEELIRAIRMVAVGRVYVDPHLAGKLVSVLVQRRESFAEGYATLSERETEVLRLIAHGYSNKEVAAQLNVSAKTVETYKARAMEKLHLRSRVDIIRVAGERGWLPTR